MNVIGIEQVLKQSLDVLKEVEWTFSIGDERLLIPRGYECPYCLNRVEDGHATACCLESTISMLEGLLKKGE